jgi:hypothetical protein
MKCLIYEIDEENPTSFARNLFCEMFDGRSDKVVTDDGRQPATPIISSRATRLKTTHLDHSIN